METKQTIQVLLLRTLSLIRRIEESKEEQRREYRSLLIALERIASALQKDPVDENALRKGTYYIVRDFDGPLYNEIEQEAYDLAGEIGFLRRRLKEN